MNDVFGGVDDRSAAARHLPSSVLMLDDVDDEDDDDERLQSLFHESAVEDRIALQQLEESLRARFSGTTAEPVRLGRYELSSKLGEGGMGVVYKAFDPERSELVAIKTLSRLDPERLYYLKREFRALQETTHPNLVSLHELHSIEGQTFFTMELIDGRNLVDHLAGASTSEVVTIFRQVALAIAALHAARKLHRDIKPSNVLVTPEGRAVLLDFGLVHDLGTLGPVSSTGLAAGTLHYLSPEQAARVAVTEASDWYAFGAMLYEVLCGSPPFGDLEPDEILPARQSREPVPPRHLAPDVDPELDSLCVALVRRDPDARPGAAEILRRLAVEQAPGSSPRTVFVGRETELALLDRAFDEVERTGAPVVVDIAGDPGIGKTGLVQHFVERIRARRNPVVLLGRCYQHESVPYPGFDSLVDALVHKMLHMPARKVEGLLPRDIPELARLFPVLLRVRAVADAPRPTSAAADPHESRARAFAALRELLARYSDRRGPLVVWLDDLQWGDGDSARLLSALARSPGAPQMLLIASRRHVEAKRHPVVAELAAMKRAGADVRGIPLAPLTRADATSLALELLGEHELERAQRIADESDGNPLLLSELARTVVGSARRPLPRSVGVAQMLDVRVAALSSEARRLLEIVAVAGVPVEASIACEAAHLRPHDRRTIGELTRGNLVTGHRAGALDQLLCFHDRVREVVIGRLDPDALASRHLCVAEVLESRAAGEPAELANHFRAAGQPLRGLRYVMLAAQQAADTLAFDRAASLYRLALELTEAAPERRIELYRGLGDALSDGGRGPEAADAYLAACEGADATQSLELRRLASDRLLRSGHLVRGHALIDDVLRSFGMQLPRSRGRAIAQYLFEHARLWMRGLSMRDPAARSEASALATIDACWAAAVGVSFVDPIASAAFIPRHLRLALDAGDPARVARGLCLHAMWLSASDPSAPAARRMVEAGRELAARLDDPYASAFVGIVDAHTSLWGGRFSRAFEIAEATAKALRAQRRTLSWELNQMQVVAASALVWMGDIHGAYSRLQRELTDAHERGDKYGVVVRRGNRMMTFGLLAQDDAEAAAEELRLAKADWPEVPGTVQYQLYNQAEVTLLLYTDPAQAWRRIRDDWAARWVVLQRSEFLRVWARALRGASAIAAAGDPAVRDGAIQDAEAVIRDLARERPQFARAVATSLAAGVAARRGDRSTAIHELDAAAHQLDGLGMRLWAACARRELGVLVGGDRGASLVREADAMFEQQSIRNPPRFRRLFVPGFD